MKSKILFSDLDDTLLNKDKTISDENRKAIIRLLEQGHYFVAVTGKPMPVGRRVVMELGLTMPGCYMVAFNGAQVYDCAADRILTERTLRMDAVREIIDEAEQEGIHVQTYQQNHILTREHNKELDFYLGRARMEYKLVPDIFSRIDKEPNKVVLIDLEDQQRLIDFRENFKRKHPDMEEWCNCFFSCDEYLEFCPKDTNKGLGVKYLSEFLNVPLKNTVAVGDERNDIAMLKAAGVGAAVKNAISKVKEAADYITENDHENGAVAEVIEKFVLNEI